MQPPRLDLDRRPPPCPRCEGLGYLDCRTPGRSIPLLCPCGFADCFGTFDRSVAPVVFAMLDEAAIGMPLPALDGPALVELAARLLQLSDDADLLAYRAGRDGRGTESDAVGTAASVCRAFAGAVLYFMRPRASAKGGRRRRDKAPREKARA